MLKRDFIRNAIFIVIALVAILLLRSFVFSTIRVHEPSSNAYIANNDILLFNQNRRPARKDLVVYEVDGTRYIGRVIATPGQSVTFMDDILYLNNQATSEPYLDQVKSRFLSKASQGTLYTEDFSIATLTHNKTDKIPKDTYLILNDNRKSSKDSRTLGLISRKNIKGIVAFRVWPLEKFGFLRIQ
ncbi:signal peptidase I [Streptococcus sp. DD12]|uniref:signal peptidase I n=1 Tax=Streptococcus sp. DD12 TaxID=1777880 RepID=UPI000791E412|nr:signal peptidase I [Streptococcus sp. DD12]KXT76401.1 Signal peptidase I [Streptococcus sp. DD12]